MRFSRRIAPATIVVLATATGCAAIPQSSAVGHEWTLAAAGFQMKLASTPETTGEVASLPTRKLTRVPYQGEIRWVHADPDLCKCIYVGIEQGYGRYQNLVIGQRIAEEEQDTEVNMDTWGVWGPWY